MKHLYTAKGRLLPTIPHNQYPRPMMKRQDWLCLNGEWEFSFWKKGDDGTQYPLRIRVPFCPESLLSGITRGHQRNTVLCYRRSLRIPEAWTGKRILLHFGAVDQVCTVTVNNEFAGANRGGYLPFSMDITELLHDGDNVLEVRAVDDLNHTYPWGKQKVRRGGMWYTPVSGIWQTVWMEPVPQVYIRELNVETCEEGAILSVKGTESGSVFFEGAELPLENGRCLLKPAEPEYWSPENPKLYDFTVRSGEDLVESYFALRTLDVQPVNGVPRLCLNGKPYFFHGLLDQGYWSDGIYTPPELSCYEDDILAMKSLGFNTLRKHIKVEPEQFYYDCDRLGMIVFQDMVNNGHYSFLRDTALPTAGLLRKSDRFSNHRRKSRERFLRSMEDTVLHLKNHPCICLWTIFNEGWGQFLGSEAYRRLRELDVTRFIDTASGWFQGCESDIESLHIYFRALTTDVSEKPVVITEFGGYSLRLPGHISSEKTNYGYGSAGSREEFVQRIQSLYRDQLLPLVEKNVCGSIYTQVSDVEDETNGLLTYDRKIRKLLPEEFLPLSETLKKAVEE